MAKINILEKHVAELIAAGEVVERPSSVIKELIENSIDSGATKVTVEIKNGGITFMRVTDNGCGIFREDVPKAFLRHATSKIKDQDDLEKISTLGFRGEALASIAAVSRVEMLTCTTNNIEGTRYVISGSNEESCDAAGCPFGTSIIVRDLFYNTPARMKFLKKDVSESNAVAGVLDRIALSHPEVSFKFIRDGKQCLNTSGDGNLISTIYSVYGKDFTNSLIPVSYELNGVKISGFVSRPTSSRPNRSMQHFFINGRYIKSRTAMVALEEAFKGSVMVGKFPSCVLHIGISFDTVDVNAHPAKIEVRFMNEKPIFDAIYHGVKSALLLLDKRVEMTLNHKDNEAKPSMVFNPKKEGKPIIKQPINNIEVNPFINNQKPKKLEDDFIEPKKVNGEDYNCEIKPEVFIPVNSAYNKLKVNDVMCAKDIFKGNDKILNNNTNTYKAQNDSTKVEYTKEEPEPKIYKTENQMDLFLGEELKKENNKELKEDYSSKFIGEAFNTYIIIEQSKSELMLIDKHAAHERMIYEKLKKETGKSSAQFLIEPIVVTLDKNEYSAVLENLERMNDAGFEIGDFGSGAVIVRAAPTYIEGEDIKLAVIEIAGYLMQNKKDINTEHMDWIYHNVACRAAIKAGQNTKPQELIEMVKILEDNKEIRYCPHGRPVSIIIKKKEIERQFGRA